MVMLASSQSEEWVEKSRRHRPKSLRFYKRPGCLSTGNVWIRPIFAGWHRLPVVLKNLVWCKKAFRLSATLFWIGHWCPYIMALSISMAIVFLCVCIYTILYYIACVYVYIYKYPNVFIYIYIYTLCVYMHMHKNIHIHSHTQSYKPSIPFGNLT